MYRLIQTGMVSMAELKSCYTLDEALKLHALVTMRQDIEAMEATELRRKK